VAELLHRIRKGQFRLGRLGDQGQPRLRSGMPCLGLEFSMAQTGRFWLVTAICTRAACSRPTVQKVYTAGCRLACAAFVLNERLSAERQRASPVAALPFRSPFASRTARVAPFDRVEAASDLG
jgi:hypothetical protein